MPMSLSVCVRVAKPRRRVLGKAGDLVVRVVQDCQSRDDDGTEEPTTGAN